MAVKAVKKEAAVALDDTDKELLNKLQGSFPLTEHPFAAIGELIGIDQDEVMRRTQRLKDERLIRELGPIFDTRALGYKSMLVAAKVPHDRRREAAKIINEHPGVSHNYLRNHDFNLWFTIAVSPNSQLGLDRTLEIVQQQADIEKYRQLPTLTLFKINMNLEMKEGSDALSKKQEDVKPRAMEAKELSEDDMLVVRYLQGDMPVVESPYDAVAEKLGWDTDRLLSYLTDMTERGLLRRMAAVLYHRRAGYSTNGMGVWEVPQEDVQRIGPQMAAFRGVSHCYQRPVYSDWPYSIFTMAHGRSREEGDGVSHAIAVETGIKDYTILYSVSEYKKVRLNYFSKAFEEWEEAHG